MRRSTKIIIGVIIFIIICLIVGLTLYFVLKKKHNTSTDPTLLLAFLAKEKNYYNDFKSQSIKLTTSYNTSIASKSGKELLAINQGYLQNYSELLSNISQFVNNSENEFNSILVNGKFDINDINTASNLIKNMNIDASKAMANTQITDISQKISAIQTAINLFISQIGQIINLGSSFI
jgi:hypothetical protein